MRCFVSSAAKGHASGKAGLVRDDDLLKKLQAAFRVGRLPTRESINLTLTLGEIPFEVKLRQCDMHETSVCIPREDRTESKYGLAMRALIARSSQGDEGWCHFSKYCPVVKVLAFTRSDELG